MKQPSQHLYMHLSIVAALVGLWAVTLAAQPADEEHTYGHTKSEYFSSG